MRITIKNESGQAIEGFIQWYDSAGDLLGAAEIPVTGIDLSDSQVEYAVKFRVESPGYYWFGTSQLYDDNVFTLVKKPSMLPALLVGAVVSFIMIKGSFFNARK